VCSGEREGERETQVPDARPARGPHAARAWGPVRTPACVHVRAIIRHPDVPCARVQTHAHSYTLTTDGGGRAGTWGQDAYADELVSAVSGLCGVFAVPLLAVPPFSIPAPVQPSHSPASDNKNCGFTDSTDDLNTVLD